MKTTDAVMQEIWRVKDRAFDAAGRDPRRFVHMLRERSADLRRSVKTKDTYTLAEAVLHHKVE